MKGKGLSEDYLKTVTERRYSDINISLMVYDHQFYDLISPPPE